jgi:hypothetical protein
MICGAKKTQFLLHGRETARICNGGFFFKGKLENAFESIDIDQFERKRTLTGCIDSLGSVSLCQPEQLLSLTQTAPGELSFQQPVCKSANGWTDSASLLPVEIRIAHCVRSTFFRIVFEVGCPATSPLLGVSLDYFAIEINAYHGAIGSHVDFFANVLSRNGVQG